MVGCTTAINATLNSDLTELPRLPGEDVCLPCERGKVAGQAPGLCWWIWRPVHPYRSWNHSSSGRMSWISWIILDYLESGSSSQHHRGWWWLPHMFTSWIISWFLSQSPISNGDFSAIVLPPSPPSIPPPPGDAQKGWHACLHCMPIGRVPGQHSSRPAKVGGFFLPGQFHLFHYLLFFLVSNSKVIAHGMVRKQSDDPRWAVGVWLCDLEARWHCQDHSGFTPAIDQRLKTIEAEISQKLIISMQWHFTANHNQTLFDPFFMCL